MNRTFVIAAVVLIALGAGVGLWFVLGPMPGDAPADAPEPTTVTAPPPTEVAPPAPPVAVTTRLEQILQQDKHTATVLERVGQIVALGGAAAEPLARRITRGDGPMPVMLEAAGFVGGAGGSLHDSVEAVASSEASPWRPEALLALLRMGGAATESVIARLPDLSDRGLRHEVLAAIWQLPSREALSVALESLGDWTKGHAGTDLAATLEASVLPRLRVALSVAESPDAETSVETLASVLRAAHPDFLTVPGGMAQLWAVDRLVASDSRRAVGVLRDVLAEMQQGTRPAPPHVRAAVLGALARLGHPLDDDERVWLAENHRAAHALLLTLDANDLTRALEGPPETSNG